MVSGDFTYVECWNELKVKNWKIAKATGQRISPFKFIICFTHSNSLKLNSLRGCSPSYLIWHRWWLLTSEIIESLISSLRCCCCWRKFSRAFELKEILSAISPPLWRQFQLPPISSRTCTLCIIEEISEKEI